MIRNRIPDPSPEIQKSERRSVSVCCEMFALSPNTHAQTLLFLSAFLFTLPTPGRPWALLILPAFLQGRADYPSLQGKGTQVRMFRHPLSGPVWGQSLGTVNSTGCPSICGNGDRAVAWEVNTHWSVRTFKKKSYSQVHVSLCKVYSQVGQLRADNMCNFGLCNGENF